MKRTFCDICGKETTEIDSMFLHSKGIYGSNVKEKFDVCLDCRCELSHRIARVEYEFVKKKEFIE